MLDIISQILWYGILATPIVSLFIVRKLNLWSIRVKILSGVLITIVLAAIFYVIAMAIVLRNGLGPDSLLIFSLSMV